MSRNIRGFLARLALAFVLLAGAGAMLKLNERVLAGLFLAGGIYVGYSAMRRIDREER